MTHIELWNRIELTMEDPPCIIEFDRRGFAWWEDDCPIATVGVAVAMVGNELTPEFIERSHRANLIDWEWSYLMHFEMALIDLFKGDLYAYNRTRYFPLLPYKFVDSVTINDYRKLKSLFIRS